MVRPRKPPVTPKTSETQTTPEQVDVLHEAAQAEPATEKKPLINPEEDSKLRKWASDNAYTLIFLSILFVITWVLDIVFNIIT